MNYHCFCKVSLVFCMSSPMVTELSNIHDNGSHIGCTSSGVKRHMNTHRPGWLGHFRTVRLCIVWSWALFTIEISTYNSDYWSKMCSISSMYSNYNKRSGNEWRVHNCDRDKERAPFFFLFHSYFLMVRGTPFPNSNALTSANVFNAWRQWVNRSNDPWSLSDPSFDFHGTSWCDLPMTQASFQTIGTFNRWTWFILQGSHCDTICFICRLLFRVYTRTKVVIWILFPPCA